jgi:hypothetical protein
VTDEVEVVVDQQAVGRAAGRAGERAVRVVLKPVIGVHSPARGSLNFLNTRVLPDAPWKHASAACTELAPSKSASVSSAAPERRLKPFDPLDSPFFRRAERGGCLPRSYFRGSGALPAAVDDGGEARVGADRSALPVHREERLATRRRAGRATPSRSGRIEGRPAACVAGGRNRSLALGRAACE